MLLAGLPEATTALLAAFSQQLTALGVELPQAQYVASGLVPWDGESLTISVGEITQGTPDSPMSGTMVPPSGTYVATFYVQLIRAVAGITEYPQLLPDYENLGESGLASVGDAGALVRAAQAIHAQYQVTAPGEGFEVGPLQPLGPDGGYAAARLTLKTALS